MDIHTITHSRACSLFLSAASDRALAIVTTWKFRNGYIMQLTLVFRVVLLFSFIIIFRFLFVLSFLTLSIVYVIITLDKFLAFTLASSELTVFFLFAVREHDYVALKFTVLFNSFKKL